METEYIEKELLDEESMSQIQPQFFGILSYTFYSKESEYLNYIIKMLYVQVVVLTLVYIFALLTFYLESFQHILFFVNGQQYLYFTFLILFILIFWIISFLRRVQNMMIKLTLFIITAIIITILFGNILGLIGLDLPQISNVYLLVYMILLGYSMVISFIIVIKNVPPTKLTFEKLAAASILSQLILFIIFVSIYNEEWFFIATCWLFHYFYCLCMINEINDFQEILMSDLMELSLNDYLMELTLNNYLLEGLILYSLATCLAIGFIGIVTIDLIFKSIKVLFF